ncbi:MAG: glutamate racemase [Myxococcota bacterium]
MSACLHPLTSQLPASPPLQPDDRSAPRIAVFDSGVGGLTVVGAVHKAMPWLGIRFLGDTARLPYGTKSAETVVRYAIQASAALMREPAAALVVACNTASSCALPALREIYGVPVLGVIEPGALAAVEATHSGHIGVIGTERTVASLAYPTAIAALDPDAVVHSLATPMLVSLAEEGWFDHPATEAALQAYFVPWLADPAVAKIDTLVLGCTHYPVFKAALGRVLLRLTGREVRLVDSAQAITEQLLGLLPDLPPRGPGQVELLATDAVERFARVGGLFFPVERASVHLVDL